MTEDFFKKRKRRGDFKTKCCLSLKMALKHILFPIVMVLCYPAPDPSVLGFQILRHTLISMFNFSVLLCFCCFMTFLLLALLCSSKLSWCLRPFIILFCIVKDFVTFLKCQANKVFIFLPWLITFQPSVIKFSTSATTVMRFQLLFQYDDNNNDNDDILRCLRAQITSVPALMTWQVRAVMPMDETFFWHCKFSNERWWFHSHGAITILSLGTDEGK